MKNNIGIISMRKNKLGKRPYFAIVFEWEDVLIKQFQLKVSYASNLDIIRDTIYRIFDKYLSIKFKPAVSKNLDPYLFFEMTAYKKSNIFNREEVISYIIDYYISDEDYEAFIKNHDRMKMIFISNRAVYEYMIRKNCPLNIRHLPLSLPDKWIPDDKTQYKKEYDVILTGRPNKKLLNWLMDYMNSGHELSVLVSSPNIIEDLKKGLNNQAISNVKVEMADSREQYMNNLKKSRIAIYDIKGMDEGESYTAGWKHVTPRFLEMIAAQCYIIARYEENEDTNWYELNSMFLSCNTFEQFSSEIEKGLKKELDLDKYRSYLKRNCTSQRCNMLVQYLNDIFEDEINEKFTNNK